VFFLCAGLRPFCLLKLTKTKTALPKQSRKDTSETNQRLENWGASLAGLRPARDA